MRVFLMIALLASVACGATKEEAPAAADTATPEAAALPTDVALAIKVAKAIAANPAASDSILTAIDLTPAGFDSLLYNIASDSVKSRLYNAARQ